MLRGFWLAVFALAVIQQWFSAQLGDASPNVPGWMLASAWGAAALYAVGAAVTLFGAENEERTRQYLQTLPVQWMPMFLAKVTLAVVSALLLAISLCISGWLLGGQVWPSTHDTQVAVSVGAVAVLEATVWGLLFSLLWKQPLLAAIAAIATASLGAQLAIGLTPNAGHAFTIGAYLKAIPARLLLCLVVFALDLAIGRRWLAPPFAEKEKRHRGAIPLDLTALSEATPVTALGTATVPRHRMLARLLWQTWRESWQPLLAAIPLALFLMVASSIPSGLTTNSNWRTNLPIPMLTTLLLPALLGALVFRADQRHDHRLFLTTHAARPRFVWLARHFVWFGAMLLIAVGVQLLLVVLVGNSVSDGLMWYLRGDYWGSSLLNGNWASEVNSQWSRAWDFQATKELLVRATVLSWCAAFAAYALGQCCSMLLKREVLAGFLALAFSIVTAAWALVVMYWRLDPVWFVLPLGVGAMLATWLRAPDWIVSRNGLRTWMLPALVIVVPLLGMMYTLPDARTDQLDLPLPRYPFLKEPLDSSLAQMSATRAAGERTALEYERLSAKLESFLSWDDLKVDEKTWQEWGLDKIADASLGTSAYGGEGGYGKESNGLGKPISDAEAEFLDEMSERFQEEEIRSNADAKKVIVQRLLALSQKPHCQFPSNFSDSHLNYMLHFLQLLDSDGIRLTEAGNFESALTRFLARIRIQGQLSQGQPTTTRITSFSWLGDNSILAWAQHKDQTSEQIKQAIAQLQECYRELPSPREAILADFVQIRDVVYEKKLPSFMERDNQSSMHYLVLINMFPWEKQRALEALDYLTTNSLNYVDAVVSTANGNSYHVSRVGEFHSPRELLRLAPLRASDALNEFAFEGDWNDFMRASQLIAQCQTSYLVKQELDQCGQLIDLLQRWVDAKTRREALLVQLALLAYRLDHNEYPETLADLTPDYLPETIQDPFSGEEFQYSARGFKLPVGRWYRNHDLIPAGTPLLWSVGNANVILKERLEVVRKDDQEVGQFPVLQFRPTETTGHGRANLVFPLPK